jgi:ubiquinone/menaquinone biosynthesis C-methylase UbiE
MGAVVDPIFADPRLAELYDLLDDDRNDLDAYVALVDELGARSVVDLGCGTGTFACTLARRGLDVVGVDPAAASLAVARRKPGADGVRWIGGDATALPDVGADLVTMTANVAQVFLTDEAWSSTLQACRRALGRGGWLVFETRDPARAAWLGWTRTDTWRRVDLPDGRRLETWTELLTVEPPLVSFRHVYGFHPDGPTLTSDSTLRFRTLDELRASLDEAGFDVAEVRDAPDRPGLELVLLARRR